MADRTWRRALRPWAWALVLLATGPASGQAQQAAPAASSDDVVPPLPRQVLLRALENRYELDARATVEITAVSKSGGEYFRRAEIASKHVEGQILSFGRFTEPEEIRDMAVLRMENFDRDDDFWAFLPEMRRVRRLSAAQITDLFLGTDATYEDVERRRIDDYRLEFLPSEKLEGEEAYALVARPTYESGYERVEYLIAKADAAILETRHYKRGAEKPYKIIKTPRATTEEHGGHAIPMRAVVYDLDRGTRTELRITRIAVNPDLPDRLFTLRSLSEERRLPDYD